MTPSTALRNILRQLGTAPDATTRAALVDRGLAQVEAIQDALTLAQQKRVAAMVRDVETKLPAESVDRVDARAGEIMEGARG